MSSIKYPAIIKSNEDKYAYLYRLQELLRLDHNKNGKDFREGKINEKQWKAYEKNDFEPHGDAVVAEILRLRQLLKDNINSIAKLSDIE